MLEERWRAETEKLIDAWGQYEPGMLATYLVSGVEDPRINIQSYKRTWINPGVRAMRKVTGQSGRVWTGWTKLDPSHPLAGARWPW